MAIRMNSVEIYYEIEDCGSGLEADFYLSDHRDDHERTHIMNILTRDQYDEEVLINICERKLAEIRDALEAVVSLRLRSFEISPKVTDRV